MLSFVYCSPKTKKERKMFYIIKDGLFFAGYSYCGSGKMKENWNEDLCFMIKTEEEANEVQKTVGGLIVEI